MLEAPDAIFLLSRVPYAPGEQLKKIANSTKTRALMPVFVSAVDCTPAVSKDSDQMSDCSTADTNTTQMDSPLCDRVASPLQPIAMGISELPSPGSAGHRLGMCKPCAFMYTKGCAAGHDCKFCHLCRPGEKKLRKKVTRIAHTMSGRYPIFH